MQWVVTTGSTVDEARDRALEVLGIDEDDLEFEVVESPATYLFGLRTRPARVRARVRPTRPRPKVDRRNRRTKGSNAPRRRRSRRSGKGDKTPADNARGDTAQAKPAAKKARSTSSQSSKRQTPQNQSSDAQSQSGAGNPDTGTSATERDRSDDRAPTAKSQPAKRSRRGGKQGSTNDMSDITLDSQEPTAVSFVTGLVEAFGATATISSERVDDEALEIHVDGEDLGLLVGPRGTTLSSIAELTRTSVAQQHSGRLEGRLRVDIAGYRAKRKEALIRFAAQVADKVIDTNKAVALEPMSPPDRKILHDAVNDIDGVHTSSRGEDRNRHVVVHPD